MSTTTLTPFVNTRLLLGIIFTLLGINLVVNTLHFVRFADSIHSVIHTQKIEIALGQFVTALQDLESSQRGFLLVGDAEYLEPYVQGKTVIGRRLQELVRLNQDNPGQLLRIDQIKTLLNDKLREMDATLALYQGNQFSRAAWLVASGRGKVLMDQIQVVVQDMQQEEEQLFVLRNGLLNKNLRQRLWLLVFSLSLTAGLVGWMFYLLRRENNMRRQKQEELEASEAQLRRHSTELAASNKELEAFCYSVSHDLRTPLRGIEGFSRLVSEHYAEQLGDVGRGYLNRVRAGVSRMGQLIDDLLNLSRITRTSLERETLDLVPLAWDVASELNKGQPEREVHWIFPKTLSVYGDPRLLKVVLENLLHNAWKYTSRMQGTARIQLGLDKKAYFVRDNGAGFDMAYKDKLFTAFQRLHAQQDFPGTGIGLATVQRIIHRHGGRVWAEGVPDQGAVFYFTLGEKS